MNNENEPIYVQIALLAIELAGSDEIEKKHVEEAKRIIEERNRPTLH